MKNLIILSMLVSFNAFAASSTLPAPQKAPAAEAKKEAAPATITKEAAIKAILASEAIPAPKPTPKPFSFAPFGSGVEEGQKIYLSSYTSLDGKEDIGINLNCTVETNLKTVKKCYGYEKFKEHVKVICPKASLPEAT